MERSLTEALAAGDRFVAGVLSGTSADGIDVGICRVRLAGSGAALRVSGIEARAFATEPFDALEDDGDGARAAGGGRLADRVRSVIEGAHAGPREIALLDRDLGRAFGRAAARVARRHDLPLGLVASHGQTIWHHDGVEPSGPATLQLGDGDEIAETAGCAVACDFRRRDIAAGGEGAPLSALADPIVFGQAGRPALLLNLGGISNLTFLAADGGVVAFDCGPAGALLDGFARRLLGRPYDENGQAAAEGAVHDGLLASLLEHPYFELEPPKSTGRDTFGGAWLESALERARELGCGTADALATAARAVARCVGRDVRTRLPGLSGSELPLWVAGGGVHHGPLLAALGEECGRPARSTSGLDVPPDAREALVFAVLGARRWIGEPSTEPGATGAQPGRVLGKLCAPTGPID